LQCLTAHDRAVEFLKTKGNQAEKLLNIEDILPCFPNFTTIESFKVLTCRARVSATLT
jgi:hypothetical protein